MGLTLVTPPALEPVSLVEAKAHLKVEQDAEDDLIQGLIEAARTRLEEETNRSFIATGWRLTLSSWWDEPWSNEWGLLLPRSPVISVDAVLQWLDDAQTTIAADEYRISPGAMGLLSPIEGASWLEDVDVRPDALAVEFTAGYGSSAADVPRPLRQAILLLVAHWHLHRAAADERAKSELPLGVTWLIAPYRVGLYV